MTAAGRLPPTLLSAADRRRVSAEHDARAQARDRALAVLPVEDYLEAVDARFPLDDHAGLAAELARWAMLVARYRTVSPDRGLLQPGDAAAVHELRQDVYDAYDRDEHETCFRIARRLVLALAGELVETVLAAHPPVLVGGVEFLIP